MRVLYSALRYNYGKPEEGDSFEFNNLEAGAKDCQQKGMFDLDIYHIDGDRMQFGRERAEQILESKIRSKEFDLLFYVAFNESFDIPHRLLLLCKEYGIKTCQWDCDSSWRFQNWILPRKHLFDYFITTHSSTIPWYQANGMKVIHSQWGGSPLYTEDFSVTKKYDISLVGQLHGVRGQIMRKLMDAGLDIKIWGNYWENYPNWNGYLTDFGSMLRVFQESKICLNLSNPWHVGTMPQIKGRHFEIPKAGGFQLSTPADNLESYFISDKEIVLANDINQLIDKSRYYLDHEEERESIAKAGWERVQKEHLWYHRFQKILEEIV